MTRAFIKRFGWVKMFYLFRVRGVLSRNERQVRNLYRAMKNRIKLIERDY